MDVPLVELLIQTLVGRDFHSMSQLSPTIRNDLEFWRVSIKCHVLEVLWASRLRLRCVGRLPQQVTLQGNRSVLRAAEGHLEIFQPGGCDGVRLGEDIFEMNGGHRVDMMIDRQIFYDFLPATQQLESHPCFYGRLAHN